MGPYESNFHLYKVSCQSRGAVSRSSVRDSFTAVGRSQIFSWGFETCNVKCLSAFRFDIFGLELDHMKATSLYVKNVSQRTYAFFKRFIFGFRSRDRVILGTGTSDVRIGTRALIALLFSCLDVQLRRCCRSLTLTSRGPQTKLKQRARLKATEQQSDHSSRPYSDVRGPSPRNRSVAALEIWNEALEKMLGNFLYIGGSCFHLVPLQYKNAKFEGW